MPRTHEILMFVYLLKDVNQISIVLLPVKNFSSQLIHCELTLKLTASSF